jgi:hypothetical protein
LGGTILQYSEQAYRLLSMHEMIAILYTRHGDSQGSS